MSKLAVANIIFETTEANRIEYTGNNVVRVRANGGLQIPFGTTAQRVSPEYGIIRYNTDLQTVEMYDAGGWYNMPTGGYVNSIYTVANSAYAAANNVGPQIAPAFNQANLAYTSSNVVYAAVNSAFATINADYAFTNSAYASINSNWTVTNTVYGVANAAFASANNVAPQIAPAYNTANAAFAAANTKFSSSGGTISGAVEITADLTVHGNTRFIDQQTLQVGDPLIYLAANNYTSDVVDIGFIANYVNATSSNVHTGLFRSSGTKEYYLFQGYDREPAGNYIDPTGNNITMAVLNSTVRTSNLILGGANTINWITSGYDVANAAFGKANSALPNTSNAVFGGNLYISGITGINTTDASYAGNVNSAFTINAGNKTGFAIGNDYQVCFAINVANTGWTMYDHGLAPGAGGWSAGISQSNGNVGIGITSPANKLHVVAASQASDADGLTKIESTTAANAVNASLTTKNWSGTSQMMQWENYGLRFGSRIKTNYGAGNIYFTVGNDSVAASLDTNSHFVVNGSARAPIFYDSDDTGYYLNPNSQSNFNTLSVTYINGSWTSSSSRFGFSSSQSVGSLQNATGSLGGIEIYGGGTTNAAFMAFHRPGAWASYFGVDNDNQFAVGGWSAGADLTYFKCKGIGVGTAASASSGRIYASGELYSTIFYDYNNTGYYADPASTSVFNDLRAPGHVLQVVTALKTDQYYTTAGWENIPGMTASITPKSTSSKILVTIIVNMSKTGGGGDAFVRLLRNGATGIGNGNDGYFGQHAGQDYFGVEAKCIQYLDSPNTTSSTSYVVQINSGGGCYINSRGLNGDFDVSSSISLMEIAQ